MHSHPHLPSTLLASAATILLLAAPLHAQSRDDKKPVTLSDVAVLKKLMKKGKAAKTLKLSSVQKVIELMADPFAKGVELRPFTPSLSQAGKVVARLSIGGIVADILRPLPECAKKNMVHVGNPGSMTISWYPFALKAWKGKSKVFLIRLESMSHYLTKVKLNGATDVAFTKVGQGVYAATVEANPTGMSWVSFFVDYGAVAAKFHSIKVTRLQ